MWRNGSALVVHPLLGSVAVHRHVADGGLVAFVVYNGGHSVLHASILEGEDTADGIARNIVTVHEVAHVVGLDEEFGHLVLIVGPTQVGSPPEVARTALGAEVHLDTVIADGSIVEGGVAGTVYVSDAYLAQHVGRLLVVVVYRTEEMVVKQREVDSQVEDGRLLPSERRVTIVGDRAGVESREIVYQSILCIDGGTGR